MRKIALLFFALLLATAARAEIDHQCLNQCVAGGGVGNACLSKCEFGAVDKKPAATSHRTVEAPTPAGTEILMPVVKPTPVIEKDYVCFSQCLNEQRSYAICERACAKTDCPSTSVLCPNLGKKPSLP